MKLSVRLMASMVLLAVFTAASVAALAYFRIEALVLPRVLAETEARARLAASEIAAATGSVRPDVAGFRAAVAIAGIVRATRAGGVDPADGITAAQWRQRMAQRFVAELDAKPAYAQFRVIGIADGGRELLRVDRSGPGGVVRIVPDAELAARGDRDYFRRAVALAPGAVDVSPVELNREPAAGGSAPAPVIRAAAPIHDAGGAPFGIVVIDVDLREAFARLRMPDRPGAARYAINERGDYLVHPEPAREFAHESGKVSRLGQDFPELAALAPSQPVAPRIARDRQDQRHGVAVVWLRPAQGPPVAVIETLRYDEVMAPALAVRDAFVAVGLAAVLAAVVLAMLLARSLSRPLGQMAGAVTAFARGETFNAPTTAGGELGEMARAFTRMAEDVTEKAVSIRHSAELLDKTVTSVGDPLLVIDASGRTILTNPAFRALFGERAGPGSSEWRQANQRFLPDGVTPMPYAQSPIGRALKGESFDNVEVVVRRPSEPSAHHIVATGRPTFDASGRLESAVIIYRDLTQARETERQLRQSQRMDAIGQLTGGVAHDFNNILTVITGASEMLGDHVGDDPELATLAQLIGQAADRGAALTQHLLAFARRQVLAPVETDVNALIVDAVKLLRPTLGEHVEIETSLARLLPAALIDPSQLTTALLNLALNARDAMPQGGKLTIETGTASLDDAYAQVNAEVVSGDYVMVAVSDTGAGIPAAIRDRVFDPFFTTKGAGKGTGLGLSMVYGFMKQSGGHAKIYSEEGHGTTVKLYLPRAHPGMAAAAPRAAEAPAPRGNETVLVVEDDAMVRTNVVARLEKLGYRTLAAANGADALAMVREGAPFDLLFTDIVMPGGMSGRQLAEAVAALRPGVKILYTSGYTDNAIVHHGRLDPGVTLLNKPYRTADLARKLRAVLDA